MSKKILRPDGLKQIENILFYASTSVKSPKEGLEKILENLPVTNYNDARYTNVMGIKIALPLGIVALVLLAFVIFGNSAKKTSQPQTVRTLPASVTKENVEPALNQIDSNISNSMDEMDKDLQELDQESNSTNGDNLNNL